MARKAKYDLQYLEVGQTKTLPDLTPEEAMRIKRSAHNMNRRGKMYFVTRVIDGVLQVTRIK
jgi:hypothetical protein